MIVIHRQPPIEAIKIATEELTKSIQRLHGYKKTDSSIIIKLLIKKYEDALNDITKWMEG